MNLRYKFWRWVHDCVEKVWHWVYYEYLLPNTPPRPEIANKEYIEIEHPEDYVIYRSK